MKNRLLTVRSTDPWRNLAVEEYLFDTQEEGITLYLWQNENTVVIGRNQNAWKECRTELLEREGGRLARRSSGGGAVFHDLGNLNFTFLLPRESYHLTRQFSVIRQALEPFGIHAVVSGRNDLVLESGEKFSGNAFRFTGKTAMHHGTLLLQVDMEKLGRYLQPSALKLKAKGIQSVQARVKNLSDLNASVSVPSMVRALEQAFVEVYGPAERLTLDQEAESRIASLEKKYASWEWRFGKSPAFDACLETRFEWGEVQLLLSCREGKVEEAHLYTDSMDETITGRVEATLPGAAYRPEDIAARLWLIGGEAGENLSNWMAEQEL
jgi:lipoate-protein ligase A